MATAICKHCGSRFARTKTEQFCSLSCAVWSRVQVGGFDECWPWVGAKQKHGYGVLSFGGKRHRAHRIVAALVRGIDDEQHALHSCDNPPCCNPMHVGPGSRFDNMQQMVERERNHCTARENSHRAVVTEEDVALIKALLAQKVRQVDIATALGVKRSLVADISAGRAWKD